MKQITLTATFQMILIMVLNKTMRMEVFLTTKFRTIWILGNNDKEIKEKLYFILWLFVGPTGVYLLDFFCSGIQFNLLLSPYPCFISLLYLDLYVLGDDALIS